MAKLQDVLIARSRTQGVHPPTNLVIKWVANGKKVLSILSSFGHHVYAN